MSNTLNEIEAGVNVAGAAASVLGGPMGAAINAAIPAVETVVNNVVAEAPHQTALTEIANAVSAGAPIVAAASTTMSPTTASQVAAGMSALQALIAFLKAIL